MAKSAGVGEAHRTHQEGRHVIAEGDDGRIFVMVPMMIGLGSSTIMSVLLAYRLQWYWLDWRHDGCCRRRFQLLMTMARGGWMRDGSVDLHHGNLSWLSIRRCLSIRLRPLLATTAACTVPAGRGAALAILRLCSRLFPVYCR